MAPLAALLDATFAPLQCDLPDVLVDATAVYKNGHAGATATVATSCFLATTLRRLAFVIRVPLLATGPWWYGH